jgi:hypothetical protein
VRRAHHHFVAAVHEQREDEEHGRGGAVRDDHVLRIHPHLEAPRVVGGDGLAQLQQAAAVGVTGLAPAQRLHAGLDRRGRRFEIGLPDLEVEDAHARPLHREGPLHHLHREEGFEAGGAAREGRGHGSAG